MENTVELALDQQLKIEAVRRNAEVMTREELQQRLVVLYEESMRMDNRYKAQIKEAWGLK